jgi:hypothetical protein
LNLRRSEEGVSAAVATVLLFAGVLSIISGMMVSIIPLIEERQGSVERAMVGGQLEDYAEETVRLAETGIPGDVARLELKPHTGIFEWSLSKGGTWYTATNQAGHTFRLEGTLDLDSKMRFRHPEATTSTICFNDLRADPEAIHHYRIPAIEGILTAAPIASLQFGIKTPEVAFEESGTITNSRVDGLWTKTITGENESWLNSTDEMRVILLRGNGGQTVIPADFADTTRRGRAWTLPLPAGVVEVSIVAEQSTEISWRGAGQDGNAVVTSLNASDGSTGRVEVAHWQLRTDVTAGVMRITSSSPATLLLRWAPITLSSSGDAAMLDASGSAIGEKFLVPAVNGSLLIYNPSTIPVPVRVEGFYHSIPGREEIRIPWSDQNRGWIKADSPIQLHILSDSTGDNSFRPGSLELAPAADSGRTGGASWDLTAPSVMSGNNVSLHLQPLAPKAGYRVSADPFISTEFSGSISNLVNGIVTTWAAGVEGRVIIHGNNSDGVPTPLRVYIDAGTDGLALIPDIGSDRCVFIGERITGWIDVNLPWRDISYVSDSEIQAAWNSGSHPSGLKILLLGKGENSSNSLVAIGWAIPLPRLSYGFSSSIDGLEIATRGGFVGTNHPEYDPSVITPPPSREGPGPRLAATIPLISPDSDSVTGGGQRRVDLRIETREQLASMQAYEVRRGWDGPYGQAISTHAGLELDHSLDWLTHPGRLDLLNDYVGWVQTVPGSDESVYHANGEVISFNLQLASMSHHSEVLV